MAGRLGRRIRDIRPSELADVTEYARRLMSSAWSVSPRWAHSVGFRGHFLHDGRGPRSYLQASTFDNPALAADYIAEAADSPDDYFHRRYHLGEWVAAEGAIWNLPADQIRVADQTEWHRVYAGIDWGYQHAFACEVVAASGSGRLAVLAELYEHHRTLDDLIPALAELQQRLRIAAFYADQSEPAYIEACRARGLPVRKAENAVLPGITAVTTAIAAGMTVDPSCTGLLAEMPAYAWKPERATGEMADAPLKAHDDACDALRYGVMAFAPSDNPWARQLSSAGGIA